MRALMASWRQRIPIVKIRGLTSKHLPCPQRCAKDKLRPLRKKSHTSDNRVFDDAVVTHEETLIAIRTVSSSLVKEALATNEGAEPNVSIPFPNTIDTM